MVDKCIKRTEKKYATRPSPPYSANDCPGKVMKGNDGGMYKSEKTSRGFITVQLIITKEIYA